MDNRPYPVIDVVAMGQNIRRLRMMRGLSVKDLQSYFGFTDPRAIYKWQSGESLPTVDNLYALSSILGVPMDQILVPVAVKLHTKNEQQVEPCCSNHFWTDAPGILATLTTHPERSNCPLSFHPQKCDHPATQGGMVEKNETYITCRR